MTESGMATIEEESATEPVVKYAWLDEDGVRTSPFHGNLGKALTHLTEWPKRRERLEKAAAQAVQELEEKKAERPGEPLHSGWLRHWQEKVDRAEKGKAGLTRSGKPPVRLVRVVLTTSVVPLTPDESGVAQATLRAQGMGS